MFSPSEQLALARAVTAQHSARLLTEDNTAGPSLRISEAIASGQSYFVLPRRDLLVVDVDLPDDPEAAADRDAAFDVLIEAADRSGVAHAVVASGRDGHRHGYLVLGGGQSRTLVEHWCRDRGLDVRERGIRPPGSPHRDGRHQAVPISPFDANAVVAVLRSPISGDATARLARRLLPIELPSRARAALRHGHGAAGYESPSHARMALAVAIRSRNGPRSLLELLLADTASPLGETYRARPGRWQQQELRRLWDKAGSWLASRPALPPQTADVAAWAYAVRANPWKGMAGGSDLAVAEALLAVAHRAGTTAVGRALADLAVDAGISHDTARCAVRRLIAAGWLRVVADATAHTARVYRLVVPAGALVDTEDPGPRLGSDPGPGAPSAEGRPVGFADLGSDLARWSALGKISMRVARTAARQHGGVDVRSLARALGMRAAAVRHHLRKLARAGVVQLAGNLWSCDDAAVDPQELAVAYGVAGRRDRQRAEVLAHRARRAEAMVAYRLTRPALRGLTPRSAVALT